MNQENELKKEENFSVSQKLYISLCAVFVTCLLLGDMIGGKTIPTFLGPISVGILPFPVTFLLTDIVNDFYGKKGARFLTFLGFCMALFAWSVLQISTALPYDPSTYFTSQEFQKIFGGSASLFLASMTAYLMGQLTDIYVFQFWKTKTKGRHLWLRATGSTLISQLLDTLLINFIFWIWAFQTDKLHPFYEKTMAFKIAWIFQKSGNEYGVKVMIALFLTPIVYMIHEFVVRRLGVIPEPLGSSKKKEI